MGDASPFLIATEVGSRKSEVGSWKLDDGSWKSEVGSRKTLLGFRIVQSVHEAGL